MPARSASATDTTQHVIRHSGMSLRSDGRQNIVPEFRLDRRRAHEQPEEPAPLKCVRYSSPGPLKVALHESGSGELKRCGHRQRA
jgi:hypothetical protein